MGPKHLDKDEQCGPMNQRGPNRGTKPPVDPVQKSLGLVGGITGGDHHGDDHVDSDGIEHPESTLATAMGEKKPDLLDVTFFFEGTWSF